MQELKSWYRLEYRQDFLISSNLSIFSSICTARHNLEKSIILDGYFLPREVDLHQVIVLPKAEWERIQDSLGGATREATRILTEKKEREEMRLRSKAAVKDWPNTIMVSTRHICKQGDSFSYVQNQP